MKTLKNKISLNIHEMFNRGIIIVPVIVVSFILFFSSCSTSTMAQHVSAGVGVNISPPWWAPAYDHVNQVQYYYLPDIECYYDVWNQQFIYLDDGNWMFAAQLPASYSWYDFNNCFAVVLDWHVHNPWMRYNYYVAHYPRYYYRSVYKATYNDADHPVRGFNENAKAVVYRNTDVKQVPEQRREPVSANQKVESIHSPQRMEYSGKTVGAPVKVERQMMGPRK